MIDEKYFKTAPADPAPVDPAPVDPAPVDPAPVDPAPVDPAPADPAPVDPAPVDPAPADPAPVDYSAIPDNVLIEILTKKTGRNIASLDELKPFSNPLEKISPEAKAFLDYNIETGRGIDDFRKLNEDLTSISDIDMARNKARISSGRMDLTDDQCDAYLEKILDIDLTNPDDLDVADSIALSGYQKDYREQKIQEQSKYKVALENPRNTPENVIGDDMVSLEDGTIMPKANYDTYLRNRENYLNAVNAAANKITASSFKVIFDDQGVEKPMNFSYEFSNEDKQEMLSHSQETSKVFELFTKDGVMNHEELMQSIWWVNPKNREKAISSLIHKAVAQNTLELLKEKSNVELGRTDIVGDDKNPVKRVVPITNNGGFGIQVPINLKQNP